jgi:hypothetical protein
MKNINSRRNRRTARFGPIIKVPPCPEFPEEKTWKGPDYVAAGTGIMSMILAFAALWYSNMANNIANEALSLSKNDHHQDSIISKLVATDTLLSNNLKELKELAKTESDHFAIAVNAFML